ncbi:MAG: lactate utilization protein [Bacteroidota bacterium]|nr:lactate utilization protein [Bacteroidota bacterium]
METRDLILGRIRKSIEKRQGKEIEKPDFSSPVKPTIDKPLIEKFTEEFAENSGQIFLYNNTKELISQLNEFLSDNKIEKLHCIDAEIQSLLTGSNILFTSEEKEFYNMEAGITNCEFLIARTGSVMVSSAQVSGRAMNVFPPCHIVFAQKSQLVQEIGDAIYAIQAKYKENLPSMISVITGPSRTADIEKTLVMGAHGPKQLIVFIDLNN